MDETKVQIGEDVLLDIGIHSDWYISSIGYDGESVDVALRRKADRNKEWWLADTPQTETKRVGYCNECKWFRNKQVCGRCRSKNLFAEADTEPKPKDEPQRDCDNCKRKGYEGCEQPCLGCGWCDLYEPKTENSSEKPNKSERSE